MSFQWECRRKVGVQRGHWHRWWKLMGFYKRYVKGIEDTVSNRVPKVVCL